MRKIILSCYLIVFLAFAGACSKDDTSDTTPIIGNPDTEIPTFNTFYGTVVDKVSQPMITNHLMDYENFGIKSIGTPELDQAQSWIEDTYKNYGYTDIVKQPFSYNGNSSNNIIVTKKGSVFPNKYLIIDAHYDTINGPGTNDNGSGTALIMELARLLKDIETEYSIKFIHFSAEEEGLIGSNYYVENTVVPENLDILLVFNIDQVGGVSGITNDTLICEKGSTNQDNSESEAKTAILATCVTLYSNLKTEFDIANNSDYIPFENNGEVITGIFEKNRSPHSHTATDILSNMDVEYLTEVTKASLGAALHFAVGKKEAL